MITMCMLAMLAFSMAQTIKGKNMERKDDSISLSAMARRTCECAYSRDKRLNGSFAGLCAWCAVT